MRIARILRRHVELLNGSYQLRLEALEQKAREGIDAIVRLEQLSPTYNQSIQKLELEINDLKRGVTPSEGPLELSGDPLEFNSFYIDQKPKLAADFKDWNIDNYNRLHECAKDREWHYFYDTAMALISSIASNGDYEGDYYEFGCCGTGSFRMALAKAKKWHIENMDFYAFDSFQGLPTDGSLAISEEDFWIAILGQGVNTEKVTTIPGFYKDSLTEELQHEFLDKPRKAAFINVDCDLHESAVPVFKFIEPLLQPGTILFQDDYWQSFLLGKDFGTALAFNDFCETHPTLKFHPFMRVGNCGMSFIAYDRSVFTSPVI